jgi:hypothetical protein
MTGNPLSVILESLLVCAPDLLKTKIKTLRRRPKPPVSFLESLFPKEKKQNNFDDSQIDKFETQPPV